MTSKDSILRSPIGKELDARFDEFFFRKNPEESPMARALVAHGYKVAIQPLQEQYTSNDWLASLVLMSGLSIIFRQPTPNDLLICMIERESGMRKMRSALLGIVEFIYFCHSHCPEVKYLGGCISKLDERNASLEFSMDRLVDFYNRTLGYIEAHENNSGFWIYADMHCKKRFQELPIWQRHQREKLPFFKLIKF